MSKIAVFTTVLNNNHQEIKDKTIPLIEAYAKKINAEFIKITTPIFTEYPENYEKMQIYDLGKDNDYNIHIDWDVIVCPEIIDMTLECPVDSIGHWGAYGAGSWFQLDDIFLTDTLESLEFDSEGNKIPGIFNPRDFAFDDSIICVPKACHEVWKTTELPYDAALVFAGRRNWIGQWNLARNTAKYHYKGFQFQSLERKNGGQDDKQCFVALQLIRDQKTKVEATKNISLYIK